MAAVHASLFNPYLDRAEDAKSANHRFMAQRKAARRKMRLLAGVSGLAATPYIDRAAMRRKPPNPDCHACHGAGLHAPILVGPVDPVARKKALAEMPDQVECGCTYVWDSHQKVTV